MNNMISFYCERLVRLEYVVWNAFWQNIHKFGRMVAIGIRSVAVRVFAEAKEMCGVKKERKMNEWR